jgi:uncharacterized protein YlxP (DUF503 family)
MIIGLLSCEIHFPYSQSLKEKRKELNRLRDRIRQRYNVALAELDYQDTWQRTEIGIVTLNSRQSVVESLLNRIFREIVENTNGEILRHDIRYF